MERIIHSIGDRVTCIKVGDLPNMKIKGNSPKLTLNRDYIIYDVFYCSKCGVQCVDVGLSSFSEKQNCICRNQYNSNGVHWCASERFRKKEEISLSQKEEQEIELELKEILETKNVK